MKEWIGVDLDGTLAYYNGFKGEDVIGNPIPLMMRRVKGWVADGKTVKIFTARASTANGKKYVEEWLKKHGFKNIEVTNLKDHGMTVLYDDRCVQVEKNTGKLIGREQK